MKTRLILELGCNHQGDILLAHKMIDAAAELGVHGVKLQKRDVDGMHEGLKLIPRKLKSSFGHTYYDHRKALEFTIDECEELAEHANNLDMICGITVFDQVSLDEVLQSKKFDYVKLPSHFYSDYNLSRCILEHSRVFHASTGMHTYDEVTNWQFFGLHDVLYYCRSIYPVRLQDINFLQMRMLRDKLESLKENGLIENRTVIGYSSHDDKGYGIPCAVLLGAEWVERHFTLDKTLKGSDHRTVSSDQADMLDIINSIEEAEMLLGECNINDIADVEKSVRKVYRGF